jgi:hypothetical protein
MLLYSKVFENSEGFSAIGVCNAAKAIFAEVTDRAGELLLVAVDGLCDPEDARYPIELCDRRELLSDEVAEDVIILTVGL